MKKISTDFTVVKQFFSEIPENVNRYGVQHFMLN